VHPERAIRFLDPADEGRFRSLQRALAGLSLTAAARAVEEGRVRDTATGEAVAWKPAPMALPVSERLTQKVGSEAYEATAEGVAGSLAFALA
jgi:hypothetical protein